MAKTPHTAQRHTGFLTKIRAFARNRSGASAVEFGLLVLPFTAALFALIETAMVLFAEQVLETTTADAARMVRTGQVQQVGMTRDTFRNLICEPLAMIRCEKLHVQVTTFPTFDSVNPPSPFGGGGGLRNDMEFAPGGGGDIVIVRAFYEWPIFVRLLGNDLANRPGGKRLLAATAAFRNEPFPW